MGFELRKLRTNNSYLYHLTYRSALRRIQRLNRLESAARLLEYAGNGDWLHRRRTEMLSLKVDDDEIVLTDQKPLQEGHIEFEGGWDLRKLIEEINHQVFFWLGDRKGLRESDKGQYDRYQERGKELVFLRTLFVDMESGNRANIPRFCRYNSGAARVNKGGKIPRGPNTFVLSADADFTIGEIREVVFRIEVELPESTEICLGGFGGPWQDFSTTDIS